MKRGDGISGKKKMVTSVCKNSMKDKATMKVLSERNIGLST